jgi:hypothetical protein
MKHEIKTEIQGSQEQVESAEKRRSILIIKTDEGQLDSAESFLENRNWIVLSTTDLQEAFGHIQKEIPHITMIPVDHPDPKMRLLPRLLRKSIPDIQIILYANHFNSNQLMVARNEGFVYGLYPPVSGPSIERMVLKIERDYENSLTGASTQAGRGAFEQQSSAAESASKAGNTIENRQSSNMAYRGGASEKSKSGLAYMPDSLAATRTAERSAIGEVRQASSGVELYPEARLQKPKEGNVQTQKKQKNGVRPESDGKASLSARSGGASESGGKAPTSARSGGASGAGGKAPSSTSSGWARASGPFSRESIIVKGTTKALYESVEISSSPSQEQIEGLTTKVSCISVKSERFNGYLLAALGMNRQLNKDFIELVRSRLIEFMRSRGEILSSKDSLNLELEEVEFEDWAIEQAEFLRKSVHDGNEVAIAFFPGSLEETKLECSAQEDMLMLDIDQIKGDVEVEFDLYLFMPKNKKYVLYTPRGAKFYAAQKDRLKTNKVENLHLRKEDVDDVDKYRMQIYLNEKIEEYKDQKKKKAS